MEVVLNVLMPLVYLSCAKCILSCALRLDIFEWLPNESIAFFGAMTLTKFLKSFLESPKSLLQSSCIGYRGPSG